jgi:hypothetical protein
MARLRIWEALKEAYRKRLTKAGITKAKYEAGESLQAARGHKNTPEHPEDAFKGKNAERFAAYRYRRAERQRLTKRQTAKERAESYYSKPRWQRLKPYWPGDESTAFWREYQKLGGSGKVA